jgi:hypothetical protein
MQGLLADVAEEIQREQKENAMLFENTSFTPYGQAMMNQTESYTPEGMGLLTRTSGMTPYGR